ncbi:MAG TPA: hypothetical protein VFB30_01125 [Spirochaetia bacterium]|nr:hypothetical protein [Spirochaetia bacterium]
MRPRGKGFGVKGSSHTVLWPKCDDYRLGVLIGMIYGDGNLIKRSTWVRTGRWRVEFCDGDLALVRRCSRLTRQLFNIAPKIRNRGTWYEAYYSSRIAYEFLTSVGEHPNGKKTGLLRIPCVARRYIATLLGLICGLLSVEGSVKDRRYPRLAMEMLEPTLIRSIVEELKKLDFHPHSYHYPKDGNTMFGVYLYGREECGRLLHKVGLMGKRRRKLSRFLTPPPKAGLARKQPGGGLIRRL